MVKDSLKISTVIPTIRKKLSFLSAISPGKLIALNKHPARRCSCLLIISQLLIKCLVEEHNALMQPWLETLITVSRNQHLTHVINMLQELLIILEKIALTQ